MKRFLVLLLIMLLPFGFMGCKTDEKAMAEFAIETAGMVAGKLVAAQGVTITPIMNEYYLKVMAGELELTESEFLRIQTYLADDLGLDTLIVNRIMALTKLAGVELGGELLNLEDVDMELIKAGFNGFMLGLSM